GNTNFASIVDAVFASGSFSTSVGTGGDLGDIFLHFTTTGTPNVTGDFNGDGHVDGADFVIWQTNFPNNSGTATVENGDANGDGLVDGADFAIWQSDFPSS